MKRKQGVIAALAVLFSICHSSAQSQTQTSSYLSYDWAFFELKGKVKSVTVTINDKYSETHYFNSIGELQDEEAGVDWDEYNPYGYTRDDRGRIKGTGNGHSAWTWNGKTVTRKDWGHMEDEGTEIYLYNQAGKKTGYKDAKGKIYKYVYMAHDAKGNWTYRRLDNNNYYSEKRKIVYY